LQAKAFALLSEEGIAKGVRRIVAVTAADAAAAIAEGEALAQQVEAAAALPDAELEKVSSLFTYSLKAVVKGLVQSRLNSGCSILQKGEQQPVQGATAAAEAVAACMGSDWASFTG
jgi:alanyl-tRNA synthetase